MKRSLKNIISSILIIIFLISIFLTMNYIKNNNNPSNNNMPSMNNSFNNTELPSMRDENSENKDESLEKSDDENNETTNSNELDNKIETNNQNTNGTNQEENDNRPSMPNDMGKTNVSLETKYYVIFGVECLLLNIIIMYMVLSNFNKKGIKETFSNKDKITIFILGNIILCTTLLITTSNITKKIINSTYNINEKEEVNLNKSNVITDTNINLDDENEDITIKKGGTYTLTGSFKHSVIIDAENEDVELILNNVTNETEETATIIGLNANKITINLKENTTNTLKDGGNSSYDGCIFSNSELIFTGLGKLIVNGNQNEGEGIATEAQNITFNSGTYEITSNDDGINAGGDGATITINDGTFYIDANGDGIDSNKNAVINGGTLFVMGSDVGGDSGIDTDEGYTINGGSLVILGTDMIESPLETSKQTSLSFTLDETIKEGTIVSLLKDEEVIVSFSATKSFKTLIISNNNIKEGDYSLYKNGTNNGKQVNGIYDNGTYEKGDKITINNSDTFSVSKTINIYGTKGR